MSTEGRIRRLRLPDLDIIEPWFRGGIDLRLMPRTGYLLECIEPWRDGRPLGVVWILHEDGVAYAFHPSTCPDLVPGTAAEVAAALLNHASNQARAAGMACLITASDSGLLEEHLRGAGFSDEPPAER